MAALRPGQRGHVSLHQRRHHLQASTHGQRQQTLAHVFGDLCHRHTDPLWNRGCARVDGLNLATLLHGGPLAVGVLGGTPDTYHTAGLERGTATSTSTRPGTTSFHGGGYVSGSPPERYLPLAAAVALAANARVHVVDYRLAPQTAFPGAFDDCLHAYHWLVTHGGADPRTLIVLGDSAGGNLAVAVTAAARDQGLALPACVALISPLADLTLS